MLDLVVARLDGLRRDHPVGDVAREPQPARVRGLGDVRHQRRIQRAVQLDLLIAKVSEPRDVPLRLFHRRGQRARRRRQLARPVNEPRAQHARPHLGARVEARHPGPQHVHVVAEISHRGDPHRQVQQAIAVAQVDVHVPEPRQERLAPAVDHPRTSRDLRPVSYTHLTLPTNREV